MIIKLKNQSKLIELQDEYIEFLTNELNKLELYAVSKGYKCPEDIALKGIKLRNKIKKLREIL